MSARKKKDLPIYRHRMDGGATGARISTYRLVHYSFRPIDRPTSRRTRSICRRRLLPMVFLARRFNLVIILGARRRANVRSRDGKVRDSCTLGNCTLSNANSAAALLRLTPPRVRALIFFRLMSARKKIFAHI